MSEQYLSQAEPADEAQQPAPVETPDQSAGGIRVRFDEREMGLKILSHVAQEQSSKVDGGYISAYQV
jgi:Asp/Glu/hydantoin racemase